MIKHLSLILAISFLFSVSAISADFDVSASSAVLMVADTGEVVFEKNAHIKRGVASTTKIMTALITAEQRTPMRLVITTDKMVNVEGTSMGLKAGDKVTFHDLIYGMLLASGNDAANTAAISIAGSIEKFAALMNEKAKEIGMTNTNFVTPSGLDDENHYSTAYDMALLGCHALENNFFKEACSSVSAKLCYGNEPYARYLSNHNRLLKEYEGALGIKTGFTKKSGRCLVSAAEKNGVMLVCVTLNAPDDWNDHKKLLNYGFEHVTQKNIDIQLPSLEIAGGSSADVSLELIEPIKVASYCSADQFEAQIKIKGLEFAPVRCGETAGEVRLILDGKIISNTPVIVTDNVSAVTVEKEKKINIIKYFINYIKNIITERLR